MKEQEIISAQQELKHLRTRCGKVYALGNNRFRAVVQTTPVHEYDAATRQWVEMSAEKRQQMAAPVSYTHLDVYKRQLLTLRGRNGIGQAVKIFLFFLLSSAGWTNLDKCGRI